MQDKIGIHIDLAEGMFLRALNANDVTDDYVAALNDPLVHGNMVAGSIRQETHDTIRTYIEENIISRNSILFGFFSAEKILIGTSRLHRIDEESPWMGVLLFKPEWRGRGWGSQLVKAVSDYALSDLNKKFIRAGIYQRNESSRKCFSKAGFRHEHDDVSYNGPVREIWVKTRNDE